MGALRRLRRLGQGGNEVMMTAWRNEYTQLIQSSWVTLSVLHYMLVARMMFKAWHVWSCTSQTD